MQIIKPVIRVGNSAGVLLPRQWHGGKARVILIAKPVNIKSDVLSILNVYLADIEAIAIVGSYARNEQSERSDIDVLVITDKIDKIIKKGKYVLMLVSRKNIKEALEKNALPIIPMLREASPLLNASLIEKYSRAKLTKKNLEPHIELTKSALKLNKAHLELEKESASDAIAYSLVLRLREIYIVDCILQNKISSNKGLITLIKQVTGSLTAYEGYLRVKDSKKSGKTLQIAEAEKLIAYEQDKIKEQEQWAKTIN